MDSDEELGRSNEEINLENVSVKSSVKSTSVKQKAILSKEEVKKIQAKAEAAEALKKHEEKAIKLNMRTQQGAKEAIRFRMRIFDYAYKFETDEIQLIFSKFSFNREGQFDVVTLRLDVQTLDEVGR